MWSLHCTGAYRATHQSGKKAAVTGKAPELQLTFEHLYLTEPEAARLLDGHRIQRGERVMDPKAQIVGEVIKQLRPPDTLPTPEETRGQFQRMVELLDEPPPASVQVSDLTCPGPAGPIPLRLYAPQSLKIFWSEASLGLRRGVVVGKIGMATSHLAVER
jgi:hypothetical protein